MSQFERLSPEDGEYVLNLPYHLAEADMADDLCELLTEFEFIEYKILALAPQPLIEDYNLALQLPKLKNIASLSSIKSAIQLAAHILAVYPSQVPEQLLGRLLGHKTDDEKLQNLLAQTQHHKSELWLRPLTGSLPRPDGLLLQTITEHRGLLDAITVAPDGKYAVSASNDQTIRVWDLSKYVNVLTLRDPASTVTGLTLTPDGKQAISASKDKTLKIWNLDTTTETLTVNGHMGAVAAIAITPDGQKAISASWDRTLKVWNLETGTEIHTLQGHLKPVQSLAVTPDGRQVISGSNDTKLKIWNLDTGKEVCTLYGHQLPIIAVAIAPNGKYIFSSSLSSILSSDKPLRMWDICSRQEINVPKPLIDKLITLLETHEGLYSPRSETGGYPNGSISAIAIMPDSKQILTALNAQDNLVIKIFDLETGFEVNTLRGHETPVTALALTPDGRYAISASFWDGKIKIWELDSYTEIATLYGHNDFVTSVAITRDGRHLISTSKDTTLKVWNLSTRKEIASFTGDNDLRCCTVSPDGRTIVAGETSGRVHFLRWENMD